VTQYINFLGSLLIQRTASLTGFNKGLKGISPPYAMRHNKLEGENPMIVDDRNMNKLIIIIGGHKINSC